MTVLKISARELTPEVSYNSPTQEFKIRRTVEDRVLFLATSLKKEVETGTLSQQRRKAKELKKMLKAYAVVTTAAMKMSPSAFAATAVTAPLNSAGTAITPALIMEWGLNLALISVAVGVALSMIMLAVAGIYRMFRKRDIATEWSTDVIKGLVQVLIAIPTVYLLFYLAQIVFKNLPVLSSLF